MQFASHFQLSSQFKGSVRAGTQALAIVGCHGLFQGQRIADRGSLEAGMHGQLSKTDVHSGYGNMGQRDMTQGGAAGNIRPVAVGLDLHAGDSADLAEDGRGNTVGGIALGGKQQSRTILFR